MNGTSAYAATLLVIVEGFNPVKLYAGEEYVRAWPGGTGEYKLGVYVRPFVDLYSCFSVSALTYGLFSFFCRNYAPGILPQNQAAKKGFTQVYLMSLANMCQLVH